MIDVNYENLVIGLSKIQGSFDFSNSLINEFNSLKGSLDTVPDVNCSGNVSNINKNLKEAYDLLNDSTIRIMNIARTIWLFSHDGQLPSDESDFSWVFDDNRFSNNYKFDSNNIVSSGYFDVNANKRNPDAELNCLQIYSRLRNFYNYSPEFCVAILNNIYEESAFSSASVNLNPGQYSAGICHWRNSGSDRRLDQLLSFASNSGFEVGAIDSLSETDKVKLAATIPLDIQVDFINYELKNRFSKEYYATNNYQDLYGQATGNISFDLNQMSRNFTIVYESPFDSEAAAKRRTYVTNDIINLINENSLPIN